MTTKTAHGYFKPGRCFIVFHQQVGDS